MSTETKKILYAINDVGAYYYTPIYFTLDKQKAEKLVKEMNEFVGPNCYEIVEEELDGEIYKLSYKWKHWEGPIFNEKKIVRNRDDEQDLHDGRGFDENIEKLS